MRIAFNRRLTILTFSLVIIGGLLLARLASFQFQVDMTSYLQNVAANAYRTVNDRFPERGRIFDRNGELLAANTTEYKIGVSPVYVTDRSKLARDLAEALGDDERRIYELLGSSASYEPVTTQPVSAEVAQKVARLGSIAVVIDPEPKRIYPHSSLAAHVIGFVGWDGTVRRGYVGVEGGYNSDLAGESRVVEQSRIPFEVNPNDQPPPGRDVYLTIDRRIQALAEEELLDAITRYGAVSGTLLIMNPRNGEVLAMACYPTFDPNVYYRVDRELMRNCAVGSTYEPGSVFKIVTASLALDSGKVSEDSTYYDGGPNGENYRLVGGARIYNWDRARHGSQTFEQVLVRSWNLGTTWLSVDVMGATDFYQGLREFGVGAPTGIDLEGEEAGFMRTPGDTYWSDSDLATNSYGQGLIVTPIQMLAFANTIANGGQMMQPHIRLKTVEGDKTNWAVPVTVRSPISAETARRMTNIMVKVVEIGEGTKARVRGYTIAGKTGTAQIADPTFPDGYDPYLQNGTFVGFLPADEPRVSILIKLDRITLYASESAAPAFAKLVRRLAVLMNIPTDAQRAELQAQGGNTALIGNR